MIKNKIENRIQGRFSALSESIQYEIDALTEIASVINEIQYLLFLKEDLGGIECENKDFSLE